MDEMMRRELSIEADFKRTTRAFIMGIMKNVEQ